LAGSSRTCADWWECSVGKKIVSQMRSSGFSMLAICSTRKTYDILMPIEKNMDVYWIYTTLQMWMNDVYYKHFQRYPRLYLFGVSRGSRMGSLLCRILPVQAQIFYIYPGHRPSLLIRSEYDRAMQNRLILDPTFANWFYFDFCSQAKSNIHNQCPFHHSHKNHFNPIPPTYFIHANNDKSLTLSEYTSIISDIRQDAFHLGGTLITHNDTLKLDVIYPLALTPDYMKENLEKWTCKSYSSKLFYEHWMNSTYETKITRLRTCLCSKTNFIYFEKYPYIIKTWSKKEQESYRDYIKDVKASTADLCEELCGNIMAEHVMISRNINNTLRWLNEMDRLRSLYQIQDFLSRIVRVWMFDKYELVLNVKYLISLVKILIKRLRISSMSAHITRTTTQEILCVFILFAYSIEYSYGLFL
jgi:hypothetical protein